MGKVSFIDDYVNKRFGLGEGKRNKEDENKIREAAFSVVKAEIAEFMEENLTEMEMKEIGDKGEKEETGWLILKYISRRKAGLFLLKRRIFGAVDRLALKSIVG